MGRRVITLLVQPRKCLVQFHAHCRSFRLFRALHERRISLLLQKVSQAVEVPLERVVSLLLDALGDLFFVDSDQPEGKSDG